MEKLEYWFNTSTGEVEVGKQSLASDRLGPFDTYDKAKNALEVLRKRAAAIRAEEEAEDWS